jgi:hypothetical protein
MYILLWKNGMKIMAWGQDLLCIKETYEHQRRVEFDIAIIILRARSGDIIVLNVRAQRGDKIDDVKGSSYQE